MTRYDKRPHVKLQATKTTIHWECYPQHLSTYINYNLGTLFCSTCHIESQLPTNWHHTHPNTYTALIK